MPSKPTRTNPRGLFPISSPKYDTLLHAQVLYTSFVQGLFAASPRGSYHYTDGEDTEIFISDAHPIDSDIVGMRPAISFTRSAVQFYSLGIDDLLDYNLYTGGRTHAVLIPGTMSINCCSRNDIESQSIASVVAEHLWLLRRLLIGTGKFFEVGRQPQISATSPAEGIVAGDAGREWYCTTVLSSFQIPRKSRVEPLNRHVVSSIETHINTRRTLVSQQQTGGPAASQNGADYPWSVESVPGPSFAPEASDARGRTPDPAGVLPEPPVFAAHPLDPARRVTVRVVRPFRPGQSRG